MKPASESVSGPDAAGQPGQIITEGSLKEAASQVGVGEKRADTC